MNHDDSFSRQSFLGPHSQEQIERAVIGIVGGGGGGSHVAQQLAHLGFLNFVIFDRDTMERSNLNRLIGATARDVARQTPKVVIARRLIRGIRPKAKVRMIQDTWQNQSDALKGCDIVFGCVDGFDQRRQLEAMCRRWLIPLIDIGMTVHQPANRPPAVSGQVILSTPGCACMTCMGFLSSGRLEQEAARYGDAGINPQVVWVNGIVASAAVGLAVDLVTDWSKSLRAPVYISYRGNTGMLVPDPLLALAAPACVHYPLDQVGAPKFVRL